MNSQKCKSFEIDAVTIKISMTEYNKFIKSGLPFIQTQQSMGGGVNEYMYMGSLVTCLFLLFWSTYWCFWSTTSSGLHFYNLSKTLIACRAMQIWFFFFKAETFHLLNNAFNQTNSHIDYSQGNMYIFKISPEGAEIMSTLTIKVSEF